MATVTIDENLLNGLRQRIVDMVSYGRYRIDGTWYRAEINSKSVQVNGAVHVTFYIEAQDSARTSATAFELRSASNALLASIEESVAFIQDAEQVLYRFKFGVSVGTPSAS